MRTTVRLDDALLRRAKAHAAASGRTLNDFLVDAVRAALAGRPRPQADVALPTFRGRGLQGGVDLDDTAALLDVMDAATDTGPLRARRVARRAAEPAPRRPGTRGTGA